MERQFLILAGAWSADYFFVGAWSANEKIGVGARSADPKICWSAERWKPPDGPHRCKRIYSSEHFFHTRKCFRMVETWNDRSFVKEGHFNTQRLTEGDVFFTLFYENQ